MSYFKELEMMIQDKAQYNDETGENRATYLQLKDEINEHIAGNLAYDQLSHVAQDLMRDWEAAIGSQVQAEHPEDY